MDNGHRLLVPAIALEALLVVWNGWRVDFYVLDHKNPRRLDAPMTAFFTVFLSVFLAELGDKTQLATILFSSDGKQNRWLVFGGAAAALVLSTAIAVLLGAAAERWLSMIPLKLMAGLGFLAIGVWMIFGHFSAS